MPGIGLAVGRCLEGLGGFSYLLLVGGGDAVPAVAAALHRASAPKRARAARFRSLEKHMLENVRQPGAEMLVLVDATGAAPGLHANDRRAAILLHNHGESVRQHAFLRGTGRESNTGAAPGRDGFQMGGQHTGGQEDRARRGSIQESFGAGRLIGTPG